MSAPGVEVDKSKLWQDVRLGTGIGHTIPRHIHDQIQLTVDLHHLETVAPIRHAVMREVCLMLLAWSPAR